MRNVAETRTPAPAPPPPAPRERSMLAGVLGPALRVTFVTLLLTGIVYPFVVTGIAKVLLPRRAEGSLVTDERGRVVGSELLAQASANPAYFQPRPSAAGDSGYDPMSSGGSNLGPTSKKLRDQAADRLAALKKANPDAPGAPPVELVTASGSGLDPHLSPAAAPKRRSSARFRSRTFTRGSPRTPRSRASTLSSTSARTRSGETPRAFATRGTCHRTAAGERWGSSPLPDAVTSSTGGAPGASGFAFLRAARRSAAWSRSFLEVGPRFEPPEDIGS